MRRLLRTMAACALPLAAFWVAPCARAQAPADTWAFEPARDAFSPNALLDLRPLNEKVAGESGFVKVSPEGDFLLGNGRPVRFWAVNTDVGREKPYRPRPLWQQPEPDLAHHARFLAKRGVNMVRLHAHVNPKPEQGLEEIDTAERDWIWRTVASMKKEGIYTTISPYWAVPAKIGAGWGVPGGTDQSALGLLFFDETLQRGYKAWLRKLYAEPNPYTNIPLARDPAVAIIQIQNEDSLLFWTVNNIKGEQRKRLGRKYAAWLQRKYGSLNAALAAWENDRLEADAPAEGFLDFHNIWEMTQNRTGGRARRLDDQLQFWAETMHAFNKMIAAYLRNDLGCRQLINAGNWRTADAGRLFDAERWSYTANEVLAVNRYFGGMHVGPNQGWAIVNGDQFTNPSCLKSPLELPINLKQVVGHPMLVTESAWVLPNGNGAEGPFLIAAYQSLTGVDGYYWFATSTDEWCPPRSANGYLPSQAKWTFATPDMLGTFPAAALMYRKGYLKRGEPAVYEERSLAEIWQRKTPLIAEENGYDPNRDAGNLPDRSAVKQVAPAEAFLVGPVQVKYGGDSANSKVMDLTRLVDAERKTVKSGTGEIVLNWGEGWCTVDAPKAQGVAAWFGARARFALADVEIECRNDFGSILVVSMDEQPLRSSRKVLVQVGTRSRPTGWRETAATIRVQEGSFEGFRVEDFGRAPWRVVSANARITVKNAALTRATVLDMNGNSAGSAAVRRVAGGLELTFPRNAMYVVLE